VIREAARFAAGWLPQPVRAQLARRRFGYAGGGAAFQIARSVDSGGVATVAIGDGPRLVIPPDVEPDFAFHFIENADSRDEMASFMRLSRAGSEDGLLLDVGAHKGLFSLVHLALGPRHRALLIEPSRPLGSAAASLLRMNGVLDRGEIVIAGAAEETAVRKIVTDALGFAQPASNGAGEDVPFTTIDDLCRSRQLKPSLLKIDVEGAEAEVLRGARATLRAHHPAVCLELHFDELERRGESVGALLEDMASMGYRLESTRGDALPLWRLRRSLMAIVRVVAR
jgi:FkbM family methyltransferase